MAPDSTDERDSSITLDPVGRATSPATGDEAVGEPPPPDGHPVAASDIQEHLDGLAHELHHGAGSHDDPNLPDGPSEGDSERDATGEGGAGGYAESGRPDDARADASMLGGL